MTFSIEIKRKEIVYINWFSAFRVEENI